MEKRKLKEIIMDRFIECDIDGYIDIAIKNREVDIFIKNEFGNLYWLFIYLNTEKCEILINGRFDYYEMQYLAVFTEFVRELIIGKKQKKYEQLSLELGDK